MGVGDTLSCFTASVCFFLFVSDHSLVSQQPSLPQPPCLQGPVCLHSSSPALPLVSLSVRAPSAFRISLCCPGLRFLLTPWQISSRPGFDPYMPHDSVSFAATIKSLTCTSSASVVCIWAQTLVFLLSWVCGWMSWEDYTAHCFPSVAHTISEWTCPKQTMQQLCPFHITYWHLLEIKCF